MRCAVTSPWRDSEDVPGWSWTEFTVGPATLRWSPDGAGDVFARLSACDHLAQFRPLEGAAFGPGTGL